MRRNFKFCSVCGKKISFLRWLYVRMFESDPTHLVPISQFCSDKCAGKGFELLLKNIDKLKVKKV